MDYYRWALHLLRDQQFEPSDRRRKFFRDLKGALPETDWKTLSETAQGIAKMHPEYLMAVMDIVWVDTKT